MRFLLDTNIVSDLRRKSVRGAALRGWCERQPDDALFISVLTIGEIRRRIAQLQRRDGPRADGLRVWLDGLVRLYGERVLPIDATVAGAWGSLRAIRTVPVIDAFLAATAQVHDLMVVTQNDQDFKGLGVRVLNPVKESLSAGSTA